MAAGVRCLLPRKEKAMGRIEDTFYIPSKKEMEERAIKPSIQDTQGRSYCLRCGTMVAEQYRYCPQCGTKLKE